MRAFVSLVVAAVIAQADFKPAEIVKRVGPSVVTIKTTKPSGLLQAPVSSSILPAPS